MEVSLHALGDEALLVQFEKKIDPVINQQVVLLGEYLEHSFSNEVKYVVPAYNSLTVAFDSTKISAGALEQVIIEGLHSAERFEFAERLLYIPVCYDKSFATDLDEVCRQTGLTSTEVVRLHSSNLYTTYMIGFLSGFPYLGQLPKELTTERKSTPAVRVPEGAVAIAGSQTGIYPQESPGGWQVIGRTPLPLVYAFDEHSFLFHQGDRIQFYSISKSKFDSIRKSLAKGDFDWESIYG